MEEQAPALEEPLRPRAPTYDEETGLAVPQIAVWMVFLTIFLDTLAATISTPALPYYAREFGASEAYIGYLFAAWSFTSTFCAPMLGRLSDRIGRRKILILSLAGAGLANLGQATAPSYWVLFAWRGFSGVWAAVGASAQVYLTDVCAPAVLPDYMSKLSSVPGAAMTFGPGMGGGLSTFGLNVPILVDGCLSLAAAGLVAVYLPESPGWARGAKKKAEGQVQAAPNKPPRAIYVLCAAQFLFGIAFGTRVSMQVVALNAKLGLTALQVGYVYVVFAIEILCLNMWITPRLQRRFGLAPVAVAGNLLQAALTILGFMGTDNMWLSLTYITLGNLGFALCMGASGPLCAQFTDETNRGTIFAQVQMFTNFGRLVGPVVAGNLAVSSPTTLPWLFSGSCLVLSSALLLLVRPPQRESAPAPPPRTPEVLRGLSSLREVSQTLPDEYGTPEDYERVGKFLGDLLTSRHYRWVSKQEAVLSVLDRLLPELRLRGKDQVEDMEKMVRHADTLLVEFERLGDRHL